jgi:hypothetical protein
MPILYMVEICMSTCKNTMKKKPENPNDHRIVTPSTKGKKTDKKFTSYDTSKEASSSPQKVRENREASGEMQRSKEGKGENPEG